MPTNKKEYMREYQRKRRRKLKEEKMSSEAEQWKRFKEWLKNKTETEDVSLCEIVQKKLVEGLPLTMEEAYHIGVCASCREANKRQKRAVRGVKLW